MCLQDVKVPATTGCMVGGIMDKANATHHATAFMHCSHVTRHTTALIPLLSHHCSHATTNMSLITPLLSRHSFPTTALPPLLSHHCSHATALKPLLSHH